MAVDSVQVTDRDFVNRIHSHRPSGKLHRGHNITAASATIPSKYQTIVISNADKRGFHATSKRFNYSLGNTNPGPGAYGEMSSFETAAPSFSKKGMGQFVSKDKRLSKGVTFPGPGAGAYALPSQLQTRKDFNASEGTSNFKKPIAQQTKKDGNPAPNAYKNASVRVGKVNNVHANAAFKSQSRRELLNLREAKVKPSPCQYNVNEDLVHESAKIPYSSFKTQTIRRVRESPPPYPGPGAYNPNEPVAPAQKTVLPKKHYLCLSAPAMPLPPTPPQPGPGQYEVTKPFGEPKHFMSGSVFVSTTGRWRGDAKNIEQPGPAHYRPAEKVGKNSFLYNAVGRWV